MAAVLFLFHDDREGGRRSFGLDADGDAPAIEVEAVGLDFDVPKNELGIGHGEEHAEVKGAHAGDQEGYEDQLQEEGVASGGQADAFDEVYDPFDVEGGGEVAFQADAEEKGEVNQAEEHHGREQQEENDDA